MELDDKAKTAAKRLGDAINSAISDSADVIEAIENLREMGYEPNIALKLEIALSQVEQDADDGDFESQLTDEDLKTLERMRIRLT